MNQVQLKKILEKGFPSSRDENWKYTNVSAIAARAFELSSQTSVDESSIQSYVISPYRIVFINGFFSETLSVFPAEVLLEKLTDDAHVVEESDIFDALNQQAFSDGLRIRISADIKHPIQILYFSNCNEWCQPRCCFSLSENVEASIIETFHSQHASVTNVVTKIICHQNARLLYLKLQSESDLAFHVGRTSIEVFENAVAETYTLSYGSRLARSDIHISFMGPNASSSLYGLYIGKNRQHLDQHTVVDHAYPHCQSREVYHGILADKARGVFNGKVIVKPNAHHSEALQANHNILLSMDAEIDTKPELEIYHDDVKCSHGASVGQLDEAALFYLQSRGLSMETSKQLLLKGFAQRAFETLPKEIQETMIDYIDEAICLN